MSTQVQPKTRTQKLADALKQHSCYRSLVPMEALIGFPMPNIGKRIYITFPIIGQASISKEGESLRALFPPCGEITMDWQNGRIVAYQDYQFANPFGEVEVDRSVPIGVFPPSSLEPWDPQRYALDVEVLYKHYDELLDSLALKAEMPPFLWKEFGTLFRRLLPPELLPYYRAVSPNFCRNLRLT